MVQIQEHEDEETVSHHQSSHPNHHQSTSSEDNHNHNINPHQSSSCHPPPTYSSNYYSSNHIFHGFPAITENPSPPSLPSQSNPNPSSAPSQALVPVNRMVRDQPQAVTKTEPAAETGFSGRRLWLVKGKRGKLMRRVGLVLRCLEFMVCLVSFSVMAADNKRGWALDSFHRYIEFRYSMSVNIIGFAYSGLQGLDLLHQLTTKKEYGSEVRYSLDFAIDQILAYLLLSASSSAFTRVDDWISNWGNDKFPAMASASVGVSFLAFIAFAMSSLISGYLLCTHRFT